MLFRSKLQNIFSVELISRTTKISNVETADSSIEIQFSVNADSLQFVNENEKVMKRVSTSESGEAIYSIRVFQPEWMMRSAISENLQIETPGTLRSAVRDRCSTALENYAMIG